ncbi:hypothetical protein SAMN02910353_02345 [Ruminococcus sp. YRD2003]|uniref:hypothetical protein n=1 Tax=Ruminococcus sp. YRD2003 TaxID=1452313 RepID=UPI0008C606C7|nr:hypothetical protein SAMN02910353_02345 [Ruminococcus flavefaciens]
MTEYLTAYMKSAEERLGKCSSLSEWQKLFDEHKDKIAFMQHERIVHFLVTMMFALILTILVCTMLFTQNLAVLVLVAIMIVLIAFYIKHYYFLENTVQKMYKVYDAMLAKKETLSEEVK